LHLDPDKLFSSVHHDDGSSHEESDFICSYVEDNNEGDIAKKMRYWDHKVAQRVLNAFSDLKEEDRKFFCTRKHLLDKFNDTCQDDDARMNKENLKAILGPPTIVPWSDSSLPLDLQMGHPPRLSGDQFSLVHIHVNVKVAVAACCNEKAVVSTTKTLRLRLLQQHQHGQQHKNFADPLLTQTFEAAARDSKRLNTSLSLSNGDQLVLYSLYKQSTWVSDVVSSLGR
jgi:hypothetical protein